MCPSCRERYTTSTPAAMHAEAKVWRRSWKRSGGLPGTSRLAAPSLPRGPESRRAYDLGPLAEKRRANAEYDRLQAAKLRQLHARTDANGRVHAEPVQVAQPAAPSPFAEASSDDPRAKLQDLDTALAAHTREYTARGGMTVSQYTAMLREQRAAVERELHRKTGRRS